jgi:hypothetical protein
MLMLAEKNRVSWPRIVFESMKHVLFTPSSDPYFQKKKLVQGSSEGRGLFHSLSTALSSNVLTVCIL